MKEFRVTERQMVEAPTQINSIAEAHLLYGVPREMNSMYRDPMTGDLVFYKGKVVKTAVAQVSANGSFLFAHVKNRKKLNHPDFQWDDKKLKKQKLSIFDLYRGWSLGAAIKDIWNSRIDHLKHNLYPDWIKKQFTNSKEKVKSEIEITEVHGDGGFLLRRARNMKVHPNYQWLDKDLYRLKASKTLELFGVRFVVMIETKDKQFKNLKEK